MQVRLQPRQSSAPPAIKEDNGMIRKPFIAARGSHTGVVPRLTRSLALVLSLTVGLTTVVACSSDEAVNEEPVNDEAANVAPDVSTTTSSPPSSTTTSAPTDALSTGGGPQVPPCGTYDVTELETVAGQQFPPGEYLIHAFGISCEEVMGDTGLWSEFLMLDDNAPLPEPWSFLEGAVGAPKFVTGPGVGFRVQAT
jgi:hypothetical protein